jgi:hypothetical protein
MRWGWSIITKKLQIQSSKLQRSFNKEVEILNFQRNKL